MIKLYNCDPGCPVQNTLQFISGKWKSVILYHLFKNKVLRFSGLQKKLAYVSKWMFIKQLNELISDRLILKRMDFDSIPIKTNYQLTDFGKTFNPVIMGMEKWGTDYKKQTCLRAEQLDCK